MDRNRQATSTAETRPGSWMAGSRTRWRIGATLAGACAVATLLAAAQHAVHRFAPDAPEARAPSPPADPHAALGADAAEDATAVELVTRFALNALLAPLIDDDDPPRWTDVAMHHFCGPATAVEVDGRPMVPGRRLPGRDFTVHWHLDRCQPFDAASVELSGTVALQVSHRGHALVAVVHAGDMSILSAAGVSRLRHPFSAALAMSGPAKAP
ncbi:MAG: hypothetical protein ACKVQR_11535 [Aquabacterium sp.]